jgi:hypothetical protein
MTIRWLNRASQELIGDREGEPFTDLLDAGSVPVANQAYAEKLVGSIPSAEYEVTLRTRDGSLVRAEISSGAIRGERAPRPIEVSGHVASSRVFENTTLRSRSSGRHRRLWRLASAPPSPRGSRAP